MCDISQIKSRTHLRVIIKIELSNLFSITNLIHYITFSSRSFQFTWILNGMDYVYGFLLFNISTDSVRSENAAGLRWLIFCIVIIDTISLIYWVKLKSHNLFSCFIGFCFCVNWNWFKIKDTIKYLCWWVLTWII